MSIYLPRISLLVVFLFNCIYGIAIVRKNPTVKPIFKVALISMVSFFIARLFFIVLDLSNGNDEVFSVGVLGQVSGYLFLLLCNKSYLPFETEKTKFSLHAFLISLIPFACYVYLAFIKHSLLSSICCVLYSISICFSVYYSAKNLLLIKLNPNYKKLKGFNICVMLLGILSAFGEIIANMTNQTLAIISLCTLTPVSVVIVAVLLVNLYRGIKDDN